jgi:hypothetical protein
MPPPAKMAEDEQHEPDVGLDTGMHLTGRNLWYGSGRRMKASMSVRLFACLWTLSEK